jgi:hypothetical protein
MLLPSYPRQMNRQDRHRAKEALSRDGIVILGGVCFSSSKFHPAEKSKRSPDVLTVKSWLDRQIDASWKAVKTKADVILASDSISLLL